MEKQMPEVFQEAKYDVFISYSRKDYIDEKTGRPIDGCPVALIIDFLTKHKIEYWIDRKGIGASPSFAREIRDAIKNSKMFVFVSSEHSNKSKWTHREISFADKKDKCILTIRIDGTEYNEDIDMYLQGGQSCDYFSTPSESLDFLVKAIDIEKENYEKELAKEKERLLREEEEKRKTLIRKQIISDKEKYDVHSAKLRKESDGIISKLLSVGETRKTCPVCGAEVPLQDHYCETCGWTFVPPFEASPSADDKERLSNAKIIWNRVKSGAEAEKAISSLKKQLDQGQKQIESLTEERDALLKTSRDIEKAKSEAFIGHEYVDLDLPSGTLWATCNVGASKPSDYGGYFAWGETSTKKSYDYDNVKYYLRENSSDDSMFSKYCTDSNYGTVDNRTRLELSDDAARSNWGGSWRMPTVEEWEELKNNCDWKWTKENGHRGYKVTGKNGKSIFLPAAGWRNGGSQGDVGVLGGYWSSSMHTVKSYYAFRCYFNSDGVLPSDWDYRFVGLSVRPVVSSLR